MKTVHFFTDVPKALIKLVSDIRFEKMSPDEGRKALSDLDALVMQHTPIQRRTQPGAAQAWTVADTVPQEVVDFINGYDYSRVSSLQIAAFTPVAKTFLKSKGLI
jgi:hypothetical protein